MKNILKNNYYCIYNKKKYFRYYKIWANFILLFISTNPFAIQRPTVKLNKEIVRFDQHAPIQSFMALHRITIDCCNFSSCCNNRKNLHWRDNFDEILILEIIYYFIIENNIN